VCWRVIIGATFISQQPRDALCLDTQLHEVTLEYVVTVLLLSGALQAVHLNFGAAFVNENKSIHITFPKSKFSFPVAISALEQSSQLFAETIGI
jgi:hypothetical protein